MIDLLLAQPLVILMHDSTKLPRSWDYQKRLRINVDAVKSQTLVSIRVQNFASFQSEGIYHVPSIISIISRLWGPQNQLLRSQLECKKKHLELLFMVTLILLQFHFCVYLTMYIMHFESNIYLEHRNKCSCIEDAPNNFIRRVHPQFKNKTGFKQ